ncbi:MAG: hypothetical protein ACLGHX_03195 [Acidimicrobiia bacterium]
MKTMGRSRRALLLVFIVLLFGACDGDTSETEEDVTTSMDSSASRPLFVIDEIGVGPDQYVVVRNITDVSLSLAGFILCQEGDCVDAPAEAVSGGESVVLFGSGSPSDERDSYEIPGLPTLRPDDGELALFSNESADGANIHFYVEWGSTPHQTSGLAVDAGFWIEGSYAPTGANAVRLWRHPDTGLWLWDQSES